MDHLQIRLIIAFAMLSFSVPSASGPAAAATDAGLERPTIFKWVDQHGVTHYTTDEQRIPRAVRKRIRSVGRAPAVSAPPPPERVPRELVGPVPEQPGRPEGWVTRNADPRPTEDDTDAIADAERAAELGALDAEIAGIEGEIASREEQLLALLTTGNSETLSDDAAFREIARELPTLQADLETLRERRGDLATLP